MSICIYGDEATRYNRDEVYIRAADSKITHTHDHPAFIKNYLNTKKLDIRQLVRKVAKLKFDLMVYENELKNPKVKGENIIILTQAKKEDEELLALLNNKIKDLVSKECHKDFGISGDIAVKYKKSSAEIWMNSAIHTHEHPGFILHRLNQMNLQELDNAIASLKSDIRVFKNKLEEKGITPQTFNEAAKAYLEDDTLKSVLELKKELLQK